MPFALLWRPVPSCIRCRSATTASPPTACSPSRGCHSTRGMSRTTTKSELIKATGQDYVPSLVWDGKPVMWYDIPDFLEKAQPKPTLYPWGKKGLATTLEHWGHQVLEERVWRYVVTKIPPVLHDDHERWVFEEMQTRARGPWHVLEMRRGEFREDMNKHLGMVEAMLDGQEWILGEPSLADFGVYGSLSPLLTAGEKIPKEFPQLANWVSRIQKLG